MKYPGRIIKSGEQDGNIVRALKTRLNEVLGLNGSSLSRLDPEDPSFDKKMQRSVKLFQARNVDSEARPLKQDGEVGPLTWTALFGIDTVPSSESSADALLTEVLKLAAGEEAKRVREVPKNSNSGPEVDKYLRTAGVSVGSPWCCAFVYWCFEEAAQAIGCANPMVKTAGCLDHWRRAPAQGARRILKQQAIDDPGLIRAGMIFVIDHGKGLGHTGLVEKTAGGLVTTIEGNTDASKTREGGGVYRLTRKTMDINKGYIDYST